MIKVVDDTYSVSSDGYIINHRTGKRLKNSIDRNGYATVNMYKDKKATKVYVHRIVALAFIGDPPTDKHQVAHYDGNAANPCLDNLRWATQSENEQDKKRHGRFNKNPYGRCKLSVDDVRWIFENEGNLSSRRMGGILGVSHSAVLKVLRKESYRHYEKHR